MLPFNRREREAFRKDQLVLLGGPSNASTLAEPPSRTSTTPGLVDDSRKAGQKRSTEKIAKRKDDHLFLSDGSALPGLGQAACAKLAGPITLHVLPRVHPSRKRFRELRLLVILTRDVSGVPTGPCACPGSAGNSLCRHGQQTERPLP